MQFQYIFNIIIHLHNENIIDSNVNELLFNYVNVYLTKAHTNCKLSSVITFNYNYNVTLLAFLIIPSKLTLNSWNIFQLKNYLIL